jgi:hypothetical protein
MGAAWARYAMCESAFRDKTLCVNIPLPFVPFAFNVVVDRILGKNITVSGNLHQLEQIVWIVSYLMAEAEPSFENLCVL